MSSVMHGSDSSNVATKKVSIIEKFTRLFNKKERKFSKKDEKITALEAKLAQFREQLLKANQSNDELVEENMKLGKKVEELDAANDILRQNCEAHLGETEKLNHEKKSLTREHDLDKKELIRKVQSLHQTITYLKTVEAQQEKNLQKLESNLENEREVSNTLWKKNRIAMKKQVQKEEEKNGEPFGWNSCEICLESYGNKEMNTPRFLACGHTFCTSCVEKMSEDTFIKCPFDRICTGLQGSVEESLPKNFAVLNMCD